MGEMASLRSHKNGIIFILDIVLFFVLLNVLPFEPKANSGLALLAFIAVLWLSEALHVTITALLVPLLAVALGLVSTKQALVGFADPTIFLFFGGFSLATALHIQKLDKLIANKWATVQMSHKIGEVLSYLAENKKAYHVVDSEELARVSGTEHHGGICLLVKKPRAFTLQGYLDIPRNEDCLVLLDNVNNAQNIGGVLRTCAYFGVKNIVADNVENLYSAASMRVAEGGAEYIRVLEADYIDSALMQLRKSGYQIIHVSHNKQGDPLDKVRLKNKVVFVLSESSTESLATPEDTQARLTLASPIKSGLNIAVNAGVLLAKWYFR